MEPQPGMAAADPDGPLVDALVAGDLSAFDTLVARHWPRLISIAGRFLNDPNEVDDAVQEALLRAFRRIDTFRAEASVRTWLIRITVNVCRNRRRSFWRRMVFLEWDAGFAFGAGTSTIDPGALAELSLEAAEVHRAVDRLPERLRLPVVLHFYEGLSGPEIARVLGWNESTVWSRMYAAYRELRKQLQEGP